MENNICKILKENGHKATGFFVKIACDNGVIPVMMTNYHVLDEQYVQKHKKIKISINDDKTILTIKINGNRKISYYKKYDTTIIEIKPEEDKIYDFMELDDNIFTENSNILYNKKSIYIIHYEKGNKAKVSYALIDKIEEYEISHYCCTE